MGILTSPHWRGGRVVSSQKQNLKKYGLTVSQYKEACARQGYRCAICAARVRVLFVDHEHKSGKVRGLLCRVCNLRLGLLDKLDWMRRAKAYLKYTRNQPSWLKFGRWVSTGKYG